MFSSSGLLVVYSWFGVAISGVVFPISGLLVAISGLLVVYEWSISGH